MLKVRMLGGHDKIVGYMLIFHEVSVYKIAFVLFLAYDLYVLFFNNLVRL